MKCETALGGTGQYRGPELLQLCNRALPNLSRKKGTVGTFGRVKGSCNRSQNAVLNGPVQTASKSTGGQFEFAASFIALLQRQATLALSNMRKLCLPTPNLSGAVQHSECLS